jgi:hypothetical protein
MAAMITLGPLIAALGVIVAITWPSVAVVPTMAVLIPAAVILPVVLYPVSYTMWQAIDIAMRPVTVDDFDLVMTVDEPE